MGRTAPAGKPAAGRKTIFSDAVNPIDNFNRYFPGDATPGHYDPAEKEAKYMIHLVAYDITSPKRLRRIAAVCEDYGVRVEYSVFECDLPEERFNAMWDELNTIIDEAQDSLIAYTLCAGCVRKTLVSGSVARPVKAMLYIL
jgi:CRISPR-associated protein Cas2